ncbi:uncharacterized protein V1478_016277, partial [Vespula squamosa]
MAIPFVQPTEEDQELSNQQLQIMMALYMALQQVLRSRSFRHSSRNRKTMAPSLLESATTAIYYTTQRNTTTCSSVTRSDLCPRARWDTPSTEWRTYHFFPRPSANNGQRINRDNGSHYTLPRRQTVYF